jgi:hypothetical protein
VPRDQHDEAQRGRAAFDAGVKADVALERCVDRQLQGWAVVHGVRVLSCSDLRLQKTAGRKVGI